MESGISCAETVVFAYTSNLVFAVTRVGKQSKDLPLPPLPLAPSHTTTMDNVAYFERIHTYFCESYSMRLIKLMPIGVIKCRGEAGTKLMHIVSGEIEKDTLAKLDTPPDVSSFHFLEIDHIAQKLTVGASTLLYGAVCLFKTFAFKTNLQLKKKKIKKKNDKKKKQQKKYGELKNISEDDGVEEQLDYTTPTNNRMAGMVNMGPAIEFDTILSLNAYAHDDIGGVTNYASTDGIDHDVTQKIVDADVNRRENNDGFASKGRKKGDENGTESSTSLMMMDKDPQDSENNSKESRRPTLEELGFGEKVPRQLKVENWLTT